MRNVLHVGISNSKVTLKLFTHTEITYHTLKNDHLLLKPLIHQLRQTSSMQRLCMERTPFEMVGSTLIRLKKTINKKNKRQRTNIPNNIHVIDINNTKIYHLEQLDNVANEHFWKNGMKLVVKEQVYEVVVNPPSLFQKNLKIWENGKFDLVTGIPVSFSTDDQAYEMCPELRLLPIWFTLGDKNEARLLEFDNCVIPQEIDVGKSLNLIIFTGSKQNENLFGEVIGPVPFAQAIKQLQESSIIKLRIDWVNRPKTKNSIRLLTYNILADGYTTKKSVRETLFSHCTFNTIASQYRFPKLLKEIFTYEADVILLQEVDAKVFSKWFNNAFTRKGYSGFHTVKQIDSQPSLEGCAMFYSETKFEEVFKTSFHISEIITSLEETLSSKVQQILNFEVIRFILFEKTNTIVQFCCLRQKDTNKNYLFVNTHLFYHPEADHIRLLQMYFIVKQIEVFHKTLNSPIVVFGGDLNSNPAAGAIDLLLNRSVPNDHVDCWKHFHSDNLFKFSDTYQVTDILADIDSVSKNIDLDVALPQFQNLCPNLEFTNFVPNFVETLDYLFISLEDSDYKIEKSVAPMPSRKSIEDSAEKALPNVDFPSDHVSVLVDIDIT